MKRSFVIRGIDPETVRIAKEIAAKKGMSLNDFVLLAIREGLKEKGSRERQSRTRRTRPTRA
jgi:hypothetical protein